MLIKLLRCVLGYVEFDAYGGFAERFVNLCTVKGINLWDVKNNGVKVSACTDFDGYKKMRGCARNSGMRLKIIKKHGLSLVLKRHKMRVGLAFGAFFAVVLLTVASGSIWSVKISGNTNVKSNDLTDSLEQLGVYVGARKAKIDTETVENRLVEAFPELSWASVNMYGSKVEIEVREAEKSPEIEDTKTPSNLIAKKDGMVVLVKGYRGTNKVKEGDVVVKGDILISGVVENRDLTETLVRAAGSVICETVTTKESAVTLEMNANVLSEEKTFYYISFFGLKIKLFFKKDGDVFLGRGESFVTGGSEKLPAGVLWEQRCVCANENITLTEEEAALWAFFNNIEDARKELASCDVTKFEMNEKTSGGFASCAFRAVGTENIAEEKRIYRENESADENN